MRTVTDPKSASEEVKLYIAPLSPSVSLEEILRYIWYFRIPILSAKIHQTQIKRSMVRYAVIEFGAGSSQNVSQFLQVDHFVAGRRVFTEALGPEDEPSKMIESSYLRRVSVLNIPDETTVEELCSAFSKFGPVVSAYRERGCIPERPMPSGFIVFSNPEAARLCLKAGQVFINQSNEYVRAVRYHGGGHEAALTERITKEAGNTPEMEAEADKEVSGSGMGNAVKATVGGGESRDQGQKGGRPLDCHKKEATSPNYRQGLQDKEMISNGDSPGEEADSKLDGPAGNQNSGKNAAREDEVQNQNSAEKDDQSGPRNLLDDDGINLDDLSPEERLKVIKNRKRRLTRKVKKQLKFDNSRPCQRGYWTASRNRAKILQKIEVENLRFNWAKKRSLKKRSKIRLAKEKYLKKLAKKIPEPFHPSKC